MNTAPIYCYNLYLLDCEHIEFFNKSLCRQSERYILLIQNLVHQLLSVSDFEQLVAAGWDLPVGTKNEGIRHPNFFHPFKSGQLHHCGVASLYSLSAAYSAHADKLGQFTAM
jgi:hypothetical protein